MAGPRQRPRERRPDPPGPDDSDPQPSGMLASSSFHQYRTAPLPGKRPDKDSPLPKWPKGDGRGGGGSSSRSPRGSFGTRQQYSRNRAAASRTRDAPNERLASTRSVRGVGASVIPDR